MRANVNEVRLNCMEVLSDKLGNNISNVIINNNDDLCDIAFSWLLCSSWDMANCFNDDQLERLKFYTKLYFNIDVEEEYYDSFNPLVSNKVFTVPDEFNCTFERLIKYFVENIDSVLSECDSGCKNLHNILNCSTMFIIAGILYYNDNVKQAKLLNLYVQGQLYNINRYVENRVNDFSKIDENGHVFTSALCLTDDDFVINENGHLLTNIPRDFYIENNHLKLKDNEENKCNIKI